MIPQNNHSDFLKLEDTDQLINKKLIRIFQEIIKVENTAFNILSSITLKLTRFVLS